jgi:hypothetical protein
LGEGGGGDDHVIVNVRTRGADERVVPMSTFCKCVLLLR